MNIQGKTIFITGANRGIGAALVKAFLKNGAGKIYAGARNVAALPDFGDARVVPVQLDITNATHIAAAAKTAQDVDVLINNAGVGVPVGVVDAGGAGADENMNVNFFGTLAMTKAFVPALQKTGGVLANVVSVLGFAPIPMIGMYSASKAALYSATQSARHELKAKGIHVVGIFPGPIDTDMAKELPVDKAPVADTAEDIVRGIVAGDEDIFPDPMSKQIAAVLGMGPKALERQLAA